MGKEINGGGGWPINAAVPINDTADVRVKNDQTWLKSGVIEPDSSLYPDAYVNPDLANLGEGIDIVFQSTSFPRFWGATWDDVNECFWVCQSDGTTDGIIKQYDSNGQETGYSFAIDGTSARGDLTALNGTLYVAGGNVRITEINPLTGASLGIFANTGMDNQYGITNDGTFVYIVGRIDQFPNDTYLVKKYNLSGSQVDSTNLFTDGSVARGIHFFQSDFYINASSPAGEAVTVYDSSFLPTAESYPIQGILPSITSKDSVLYFGVEDGFSSTVTKYAKDTVGIQAATGSGVPYYLRVK